MIFAQCGLIWYVRLIYFSSKLRNSTLFNLFNGLFDGKILDKVLYWTMIFFLSKINICAVTLSLVSLPYNALTCFPLVMYCFNVNIFSDAILTPHILYNVNITNPSFEHTSSPNFKINLCNRGVLEHLSFGIFNENKTGILK